MLEAIWEDGQPHPVGYYLSADAQSTDGTRTAAHGIGAIKVGDSRIRFFDPNCGEYLLKTQVAVNLFSRLFLLLYQACGWNLRNLRGYEVKSPVNGGVAPSMDMDDMADLLAMMDLGI
jgi:hypothetical protein